MLWEFQSGTSATATAKKICDVIDEGVVAKRTVRNWFAKFRSGDTSLQDESKLGRSTDIDDSVLKVLVEQNLRQITRKLADKLKSSLSTICRHLEKLRKVSQLGVWVSHNLLEKNKVDRMAVDTSLLSMNRNDPFLDKLITGDEKWVTYKNVTRKRQ
ncbi:histone-lysine N-methyltransferase SETMAR-like [Colletes gigas]|uniref:histone-lysine N-methyltransferase SETMAR-like n=1 Tax=Colletes gigas TaxID=935657 RepID=UPI001C9B30AC|nr:histone-lysine N-methyltransferase SETMAR-like [Colletes gigas]